MCKVGDLIPARDNEVLKVTTRVFYGELGSLYLKGGIKNDNNC